MVGVYGGCCQDSIVRLKIEFGTFSGKWCLSMVVTGWPVGPPSILGWSAHFRSGSRQSFDIRTRMHLLLVKYIRLRTGILRNIYSIFLLRDFMKLSHVFVVHHRCSPQVTLWIRLTARLSSQ